MVSLLTERSNSQQSVQSQQSGSSSIHSSSKSGTESPAAGHKAATAANTTAVTSKVPSTANTTAAGSKVVVADGKTAGNGSKANVSRTSSRASQRVGAAAGDDVKTKSKLSDAMMGGNNTPEITDNSDVESVKSDAEDRNLNVTASEVRH